MHKLIWYHESVGMYKRTCRVVSESIDMYGRIGRYVRARRSQLEVLGSGSEQWDGQVRVVHFRERSGHQTSAVQARILYHRLKTQLNFRQTFEIWTCLPETDSIRKRIHLDPRERCFPAQPVAVPPTDNRLR